MINVKTIVNNNFIPESLPDSLCVYNSQINNYDVKYGDVFLNRSSENEDEVASCAVAAGKNVYAVYSGFAKRLRPVNDKIFPKYVAAFFASQQYRKQIHDNILCYSTRVNINDFVLKKIVVYFPEYKQQRIIGDIFYEIDNARNGCKELYEKDLLCNLEKLFIEQVVDYPIEEFIKGRLE